MKFEIKIRLTHTEVREFESMKLALAYAFGRSSKSENVAAVVHSVIQIDPPLIDRPCPGCHPAINSPTLTLPAPTHDDDGREIEIDLNTSPPWPRDPNAPIVA